MAWQLIYTSAPRLLEAGRSGFGSVARHRQISPLLVSAIERASQFSRQPGMDPGRVIFSYRIIPISGGRFHVLSCIRDAGADYTGRTNHIAHHVIAEAREVSQLGSQGASPADVMLAMRWIARWDEPPRYLEAADEVHLAGFTPQTGNDGASWSPVTGNAAHAWLLAAGEASRGAYIVPPSGANLLLLFADSLRLAPERLWQTPFTTSLQSKDEISDFRWIGLAPDSPLRGDTAASGRPVLDLTQPHRLPIPETPAPAAANPPAQYLSSANTPVIVGREMSAVSSGFSAAPAATAQAAPAAVASRKPSPSPVNLPDFTRPTKTSHFPVWIVWAAVVVLLILALIFEGILPWRQLTALRAQLTQMLKWSDYFPEKSLDSIVTKLLPDSRSWPVAEQNAKAINRIATALMQGKLESITPEDELRLKALAGDGAPPTPPAITRLQGLLNTAKEKSQWKPALTSATEVVPLEQAASDEINNVIPNPPYERLNKALRAISDIRIAEAEYDLLAHSASIQPPDSAAIFKQSLFELKTRIASGNDQALDYIHKADEIVALWEVIDSSSSLSGPDKIAAIKKRDGENAAKWPGWLYKKVIAQLKTSEESPPATPTVEASTPPATPSVPLYVVSDVASLKDARFNELRKDLTYFIRSPSEGEIRKLRDPGNEGKLRLNISENPVFLINETASQITPERASEALQTPLFLIAKDAADHEVMQIWVGAGLDKPFLPNRKASGTRSANILSINLEKLLLPGIFKAPLRLRLPDACYVSGKPNGSLPLTDGKADIHSLLKEISESRDAKAKEIEQIKSGLTLKSDHPAADFSTRKHLVIQAARLEDELQRKDSQAVKDLGKPSAPLFQQCGNLIVAITRPAQFSGADKLFDLGKQLSKLPATADEKAQNELLSAASASLALAKSSLSQDIQNARTGSKARSQEETRLLDQEIEHLKKSKEMYETTLLRLKELVDSLLPETSEAKAARLAAETQLRERLENARKELERISSNPLLTLAPDTVPPGTYRLLAQTQRGDEVLLMNLEIAP